MSFENTDCPCGGTKARQTMLCDACREFLKDHPSMNTFEDNRLSTEARRHAAVVLVSLARRRNRRAR